MKKSIITALLGVLLLCGCGRQEAEPFGTYSPAPQEKYALKTTTSAEMPQTSTADTTTPRSETQTTVVAETAETTAESTVTTPKPTEPPTDISDETPEQADDRVLSDGTDNGQDKYNTDPVPEGMPMPVEPQYAEINEEKKLTCTLSIDCLTILDNLSDLDPDKADIIPADGVILAPCEVEFSEGESVFDVLQRVCREKKIHMEFSFTPVYNSAYIEGIANIYEFDCGALSGWRYCVNGWYLNYGCSRYQLVDGEIVEWRYTCTLGEDIDSDTQQGDS